VRPGRAVNHSPPSSAAVMEEQSYTSTHPLGHTGPVTGSLYPFFFTLRRYSLFLSKFKRIIHKTEDEMCTPVRTGLPLFPICILYGLATALLTDVHLLHTLTRVFRSPPGYRYHKATPFYYLRKYTSYPKNSENANTCWRLSSCVFSPLEPMHHRVRNSTFCPHSAL